MIGKRVEKLVVVERLPNSQLRCKCDCGNERIVYLGHFNTGKIKSCGCHVGRHGHAGGEYSKRSREYICYYNMIARCHKKTNKRYKDYGAKGITVCQRWRDSFINFLADMGKCPAGFIIDRIKNDKGYMPGNCQWVTRSKNQRNRAVSKIWIVNGNEYPTLADAATANSVSDHTIAAWCQGRTAAGHYYPPHQNCGIKRIYC